MPRTFADTLASDVGVHLSSDYWAESCTYISKLTGPRMIVCEVQERSELSVDAQGRTMITVLSVMCFKDAVTGIDNPQIGDAFKRATTPAEQVFTYVGTGEDIPGGAWVLTFERRAPYSRGGGR
jgi:hypothetical protein